MKIFGKLMRLSVFFCLVISVGACAQGDTSFENAVATYCELYNPDSWSEQEKSADTYTIYNLIVSRQESTIVNKRLREIVESADRNDFVSYHRSIRDSISKELGANWQCDNFDQFYVPTQTLINLSLKGVEKRRIDPNADNAIVITVLSDKNILLGNAPLVSSDKKTIIAAITSRLNGKPVQAYEFVLYFDENGSGELAPTVLSALTELGVENVSLVDY